MARHRAAPASSKHKSSSKDKRKRHTNNISSSGSSKSRSKRVTFEGTPSDAETNKYNIMGHHSTKCNTSSTLQHSSSKSTGEVSKKRRRPVPSVKSWRSSCTIQSPVRQKARAKDQKKKEVHVHPYAASFSEAIHHKTEHLLRTLSEQLMAIYSEILECIPQVNISGTSGKPYKSLVNAIQASVLSKYGSSMPLDAVREFQCNCKAWDQEFRTLLEEHAVVQQEFMDLAKEIGIHRGDDAGKAVDAEGVDMESDTEFGEMIKEVKQIRKTWTTKMEKLENQIFQEESRQNILMMQAI